jgi:hypothetical protein
MNNVTSFFLNASEKIELQYFQEIEARRNSSFDTCTPEIFFQEYIYAMMNLGMREQTMRPIYDKFMLSLNTEDITTRFKNKQRIAAQKGIDNFMRWFGELKCSKDPVAYLETLPLIGKTTKWHLAQNLGIDCVKPDIHLIRLAQKFGFSSPLKMCECIRDDIGNAEDLKTIDLILWRYCNLFGSDDQNITIITEKRLEKVNNHKITDFFGVSEEA